MFVENDYSINLSWKMSWFYMRVCFPEPLSAHETSRAVLPKPFLEAPLPCIFCMSPLSNTPDSTHQRISRDCNN